MGGCVPLAPAPLLARHAGASRDERGTVTVALVVGAAAASLAGGSGVELRLRWQARDSVAFGIGIGTACGDGDANGTVQTSRLYTVRLSGLAQPLSTDNAAFTFGAGVASVNTGMRALTLDGGVVASAVLFDTIEPSVGLTAALAVPFIQGRPFGARDLPTLPTTTLYLGGNLGLGLHLGGTHNVLSGEAGLFAARSLSGEHATALYLSAADAQDFRP